MGCIFTLTSTARRGSGPRLYPQFLKVGQSQKVIEIGRW